MKAALFLGVILIGLSCLMVPTLRPDATKTGQDVWKEKKVAIIFLLGMDIVGALFVFYGFYTMLRA